MLKELLASRRKKADFRVIFERLRRGKNTRLACIHEKNEMLQLENKKPGNLWAGFCGKEARLKKNTGEGREKRRSWKVDKQGRTESTKKAQPHSTKVIRGADKDSGMQLGVVVI